jgi:hypothetical protein
MVDNPRHAPQRLPEPPHAARRRQRAVPQGAPAARATPPGKLRVLSRERRCRGQWHPRARGDRVHAPPPSGGPSLAQAACRRGVAAGSWSGVALRLAAGAAACRHPADGIRGAGGAEAGAAARARSRLVFLRAGSAHASCRRVSAPQPSRRRHGAERAMMPAPPCVQSTLAVAKIVRCYQATFAEACITHSAGSRSRFRRSQMHDASSLT